MAFQCPPTIKAPFSIRSEGVDKGGKETTQATMTEESRMVGKVDNPPVASVLTFNPKLPSFLSGNASPTSASQSTTSGGSTQKSTTAGDGSIDIISPEWPLICLSNNLLLNEVFKIQAMDRTSRRCQGLDAHGARCQSIVTILNSIGVRAVANSLRDEKGLIDEDIQSLAEYNMCKAHTTQSAKLAEKWIRLAKLTKATRECWQEQRSCLCVEFQISSKMYAEFAAVEVRRILEEDKIMVQEEKGKAKGYDPSQITITLLRKKIESIENRAARTDGLNDGSKKSFEKSLEEISSLKKQIDNLTTENTSLKEARDSDRDALAKSTNALGETKDALSKAEDTLAKTEDALKKGREHDQRDLADAKELYEMSHKTVQVLHKDISTLTSKVSDLTTENLSLKAAQEVAEKALDQGEKRSQCELQDVKELYQKSQETIEVLRKDVSALTHKVDELTAENSSLKEIQEAAGAAHDQEKIRSQGNLQEAEELYQISQRTVEVFRRDIFALNSKVSELTIENSSLKEDREVTSDNLVKERERGEQDREDAKSLYEASQRTIEALRKEVDTLNSCVGELTIEGSSLKDLLALTQDEITQEKAHSRELKIRLEERTALGVKSQDSHDLRLEKYLKGELEKSQQDTLQQRKDMEKLCDENVQLKITNAALESRVKQVEDIKKEADRASKREFQELAERNSDLSNQLHHTRAQFEQLKADLAAMKKDKENQGEASKSKFNLRDFYGRPKPEPSSKLQTPPTDAKHAANV